MVDNVSHETQVRQVGQVQDEKLIGIAGLVEATTGVKLSRLQSTQRTQDVCDARRIFVGMAISMADADFSTLARFLKKDPSAIKKMAEKGAP